MDLIVFVTTFTVEIVFAKRWFRLYKKALATRVKAFYICDPDAVPPRIEIEIV